MDAVILILVIVILVLLCKKTFSSVIYATVIVDLFLHLLNYFNVNLIKSDLLNKVPSSFIDVINNNTAGVLNTILGYLIILVYLIFEFLLIKYFIKRR